MRLQEGHQLFRNLADYGRDEVIHNHVELFQGSGKMVLEQVLNIGFDLRDRPHERLESQSRSRGTLPPLLLKAPQDVLVFNYYTVALPQTEFNQVGVLIEESFPQTIEFSRELCAQDAEFEEALGPLFVVHRKAAQTTREGVYLLSKGLNDTILLRLALAQGHLAFLNVESA